MPRRERGTVYDGAQWHFSGDGAHISQKEIRVAVAVLDGTIKSLFSLKQPAYIFCSDIQQ